VVPEYLPRNLGEKRQNLVVTAVATENSERRDKSGVLGFTAIVFSACLSTRVPSSRLLPADSIAGLFWN
jgi:hypothetical protein